MEPSKSPQGEMIAEPETAIPPVGNALEQLKRFSVLGADMAEYDELLPFYPRYVTTNPTLILRAVQMGGKEYQTVFDKIAENARLVSGTEKQRLTNSLRAASVFWGTEIVREIPHGRVSTQVDPRISKEDDFVNEARLLMGEYKAAGVKPENILIKIPATIEGIRATRRLEAEGIHINNTLVFSLEQVAAACDAGATVVSPFVGRLSDWWRKHEQRDYEPSGDPGVQLVKNAFNYVKHYNYRTMVLAASLRTVPQTLELIGCDVLSLSHQLLKDMAKTPGSNVVRKLGPHVPYTPTPKIAIDTSVPWVLPSESQELLDDGIRRFCDDQIQLECHARNVMNSV